MARELRCLLINDLHAGSRFGPIPPRWKQKDGSYAPATDANHWLYERFEGWIDEFKKPDVLLVVGDAVDGHAHLSYGLEVWGGGYEQYMLAKYLVKKAEAKQIFIIFGSKYHVTLMGTPAEQFLAEGVKAAGMGWRLRRSIGGLIVSAAHHIGVSMTTWQYRTTALAREMVLDRLQNEDKTANLLVRGHAHYFVFAGFGHQLGIINPGFQGQTPFGAQRFPEIIPKVGLVSVDLPTLDFDYRVEDGPMLEMWETDPNFVEIEKVMVEDAERKSRKGKRAKIQKKSNNKRA